jgi:uncharacterized membrane protein YbhN (UPF0104 family)
VPAGGGLEPLTRYARRLVWVWPVAVIATLAYTFWTTDRAMIPDWTRLAPRALALAGLVALLPWFTNTLRLWNWLRWLGERRSYHGCLRVVLACEVGAAITPTALGGAPFKVAMLVASGLRTGRALSVTALGTAEDAVAVTVLLPAGLVFVGGWSWLGIYLEPLRSLPGDNGPRIAVGVAAALFVAAVVWLLLRRAPARWLVRLRQVWRDAHEVARFVQRRGTPLFVVNALLATVQWALRLSIFPVLAVGLGLEVDPVRLALLQWVCFALMSLVPSPGAVGAAEAVFLAVHAPFLPAGILGVAMAGWRLLTFYALNLIALFLLLIGERGSAEKSCAEGQEEGAPEDAAGRHLRGGVAAQHETRPDHGSPESQQR